MYIHIHTYIPVYMKNTCIYTRIVYKVSTFLSPPPLLCVLEVRVCFFLCCLFINNFLYCSHNLLSIYVYIHMYICVYMYIRVYIRVCVCSHRFFIFVTICVEYLFHPFTFSPCVFLNLK